MVLLLEAYDESMYISAKEKFILVFQLFEDGINCKNFLIVFFVV